MKSLQEPSAINWPTLNAPVGAPPFKILDRVARSCSYGLFPWIAFCFGLLSTKNMAHHVFQSEGDLPAAAPKAASASLSVCEKLALYGSSALSGVEHE